MQVVRLDPPNIPIKERKISSGSWAAWQRLYLREVKRLDKEVPLPDAKTRGFVLNR